MDLFLFNNQESKEHFVLTRNYYKDNSEEKNEEKYNVTVDLVDDKFLPLITIMQIFDLKQTHIIESEIYKIGDLTIEFSKMSLEKEKNKYTFIFCINNMYGHTFETTYNYSIDVVSNLFDEVDEKKIKESCILNHNILRKYNIFEKKLEEEKIKIIKEEDYIDNTVSDRFPKIKLIQYLLYL